MIRAIVALGKWLDARFPAKVVVTEERFNFWVAAIQAHSSASLEYSKAMTCLEARISALEESIRAIKDLLAKAATAGAQAEKRRSDFIAQGRMSD